MIEANAATLIAGGLMVGFGTRLGNGCTSGHGVCGLARLSPRSIAATATFMAAGFLTVFVVRHSSPEGAIDEPRFPFPRRPPVRDRPLSRPA